jgi:hypothetical protein
MGGAQVEGAWGQRFALMLMVGDIGQISPRPLASIVEETWGTEKEAAAEGNSKMEQPV